LIEKNGELIEGFRRDSIEGFVGKPDRGPQGPGKIALTPLEGAPPVTLVADPGELDCGPLRVIDAQGPQSLGKRKATCSHHEVDSVTVPAAGEAPPTVPIPEDKKRRRLFMVKWTKPP
jgi:hypothetical protein